MADILVDKSGDFAYGCSEEGGLGGLVLQFKKIPGGSWVHWASFRPDTIEDGEGCIGYVFRLPFTLPTGSNSLLGGNSAVAGATPSPAGGGDIYGVTLRGGTGTCKNGAVIVGCGTVFRVTPPTTPSGSWHHVVIYNFKGGSDGAFPMAGLTAGAGVVYGTTSVGGTKTSNCSAGCGTVFKLTPLASGKWSEAVIYRFGTHANDGIRPSAPVVYSKGTLYGTTGYGGGSGFIGTAFRLTPVAHQILWKEAVIHRFATSGDGYIPLGGVIFGPSGALYGTTQLGSVSTGAGTVYRLTRPALTTTVAWNETVLYSFKAGAHDGGYPMAGLTYDAVSGFLYGTTFGGGGTGCGGIGCGTIFKLKGKTETVLHRQGSNTTIERTKQQMDCERYSGFTLRRHA